MKGLKLRDLIGGSWASAKHILADLLVGAGIWSFSLLAILVPLHFLASRSPQGYPDNPVFSRLPHNVFESVLWVLVSVSAGFCEEVVFRGYLQRQFLALTGNGAVAVILQAILFGFGHAYEGLAIGIANVTFGVLFGVVAWWRRSLRPGMIAHAWTDIFVNLLAKAFGISPRFREPEHR